MRILVIGSGFIATSIIHKLESEGHALLVYSRTKMEGIKSKQIVGNIFHFEDFIKTLSWKPQIIIHTAWVTTHGLYQDDPSNYEYAHFTSQLARHITQSDIEHLIVLGTCAEYGARTEASTAGITNLNPQSLYAQQKVLAFNSVKESLLGSSVRISWARIFQPYGLNQDRRRLIPYLINSLKNDEQIQLGDTSSIRDWITTRDIASAISWIIHNETPLEIDVGTTFGFTNIELLRRLEGLLGNTTQWARLAQQRSSRNEVSLVGQNSPLFSSGWLPSESLDTGLKWVLDS